MLKDTPQDPHDAISKLAALRPSQHDDSEPEYDGATPSGLIKAEHEEDHPRPVRVAPAAVEEPVEGLDEPTVPRHLVEMREQLAAERASREALQREVEFIRSARETPSQPAQPAEDPVAKAMDLLRVDAKTWNGMIADPEMGAAVVTDALQRMLLLGHHLAKDQIGAQSRQEIQVAVQKIQDDAQAEKYRTEFWRRNPNLQKYEKVVMDSAREVARIAPEMRWNGEQVMDEVAKRTKAQLADWDIEVADEPEQGNVRTISSARRKIKPAQADMSTGSGRAASALTPVQRQLVKLAQLGR